MTEIRDKWLEYMKSNIEETIAEYQARRKEVNIDGLTLIKAKVEREKHGKLLIDLLSIS